MNGAPDPSITPARLREWPLPEPGASKHSRGHVVVVGGSRTAPGAVILAGLAALRVGAGVLAMVVPDEVAVPLAVAVPEAGVTGWSAAQRGQLDPVSRERLAARIADAEAVLVGPGIDDVDDAKAVVTAVAELAGPARVVLDAYALGALPELDDAARQLAGRLVLTPNHSEASRLLGRDLEEPDGDQRNAEICRQVAERWRAVVSCYGAVAVPGGPTYLPSTGHPGLGTSGSGDVLAGAVAGLLARGAAADQAACWATYLHVAAGDRLAARIGRLGFLARELLDEVPLVLAELSS